MTGVSSHIAALHKNQTLNAIALVTTIVVGGFTLYYLMHQTKLLKLQIEKHEAERNANGSPVHKKAA
jgi:hypothetical protein